ncbi:MAG TPA: IclR family transcriptional regulator [Pseudolysinimonas sp.]|nr:IclR family transcriptional regulator [Pseudolysinimonas sp.]
MARDDAGAGPSQSSLLPKVARILDHLSTAGDANATELAAAVDEPRSSMYRLLRSLADIGWVEETGARGVWRLGGELFRLSAAAINRIDERQVARPHLERLHQATEQTVYLCIRNDMRAVCIDRLEGVKVASQALKLGGSLPLHQGAAPLVLLAFGESDLWEQWRRTAASEQLELRTELTLATVDDVMRDLAKVRDQGYAISDGDVTPGIAAIGVPVFNRNSLLVASVSVSGMRESILDAEGRVLELVLAAGRAISRSLGYREP